MLIKKIKDIKPDINQKLKNLKISPVKFELKKLDVGAYVIVFNFPFKFKLIYDSGDGFCKLFKFHKGIQSGTTYAQNTDYTSENIKEMVKPFSVNELYCNITEYSYTNDEHSHLHTHNELLHMSFVDINFYDTRCIRKFKKKVNSFKGWFAGNQRNLNANG